MRAIIAFAILVVGIGAKSVPLSESLPTALSNERLVSDAIVSAIEDVSESIKDAGLDPLVIKREAVAYALPVPILFNAAAFVEEVLSTGLSDIVVNRVNYNVLFSRLNFDIELPLVHLSAGVAAGEVTLFGSTLEAEADGRMGLDDVERQFEVSAVDIQRIRVIGEVRINIGIISGISARSISVDFSIGSINTNIRLAIQGVNYSEQINNFISSTIPSTLQEFSAEINELIEIVLLEVINDML